MSKYIDREKFIKPLVNRDLREISTKTIGECLDKAEVADVVEVVRCSDCKYWRPDTRPEGSLDERADGLWGVGDLCIKHLPSDQLEAIEFSPDDYCKYGERKEK